MREAARERFEHLELNALVQRVIVTDDRRRAVEDLGAPWTQLSADDVLESPYLLVGSVEEMISDLRARRTRWGFSYYMTHEPCMDTLAPVVAALAGT